MLRCYIYMVHPGIWMLNLDNLKKLRRRIEAFELRVFKNLLETSSAQEGMPAS